MPVAKHICLCNALIQHCCNCAKFCQSSYKITQFTQAQSSFAELTTSTKELSIYIHGYEIPEKNCAWIVCTNARTIGL